MSGHFNVKDVMDENSILFAFSPTPKTDLFHMTEDSPGGESLISKMSLNSKSSDWQSQRYKKALQRSRETKQQRKSVAPNTVQTPVSVTRQHHPLTSSSDSKENSGSSRVIIDTSIMDLKKSKSPKRTVDINTKRIESSTTAADENNTIQVSDDMRRVLSTISTNSPPRIHGTSTKGTDSRTTTPHTNHKDIKLTEKKKSPKKSSSSSSAQKVSSIDVLDYLVEVLDSNVPTTDAALASSDQDIDSNRHFHSLAKKIHEKMTLDGSRGNINNTERTSSAEMLKGKKPIDNNSTQEGMHVSSSTSTVGKEKEKMEGSVKSESAFTHFVSELKREVSQDHKELWKSFQVLFGRQDESRQTHLNPSGDQQSSSEKSRLSPSSQTKLRGIHDFLTTHYPSDNCVVDSQLVSDKRLRKEQQHKTSLSTKSDDVSVAESSLVQKGPTTALKTDKQEPLATKMANRKSLSSTSGRAKISSQDSTAIKSSGPQLLPKRDTSLSTQVSPKVVNCDNEITTSTQRIQRLDMDPLSNMAISFSLPVDFLSSTNRASSIHSSQTSTNNFIDSQSLPGMKQKQSKETFSSKMIPKEHEMDKKTHTEDRNAQNGAALKVNLRPPLPPCNPSTKADRVVNPNSKRLSWLSSLREKQKKYGRRPLLSDDDSLKDDETASVTTNDLEQYSIQKVGIDNVIAIFGTRASPSRLPLLDESSSYMGSPSTNTLTQTASPLNLRQGNSFISTPKAWSFKESFTRKTTTPVNKTPLREQSLDELATICLLPHPLCCGDVIDLSNLPRKFFQLNEHVVKLPLSIKDGRRQYVVLGKETILTACSFSSNGSISSKTGKDSANIQWCAYRSQVKSITLCNDATVALLSLLNNSTCHVSFENALDCMMFMKEFYSVSSTADIESQNESFMTAEDSEIDDNGDARGSPKPKREQEADVTSSTTALISTSSQQTMSTGNTTFLSDGTPLTDDELKVLENYRKSLLSSAITTIPENRAGKGEVIDKVSSSKPEPPLLQAAVSALPSSNGLMSQPSLDQASINMTKSPLLNEQEELIASKYRKMLKFSIPMDAVAHKMKMEQVPDNIVSAVLESLSSTTDSENVPNSLEHSSTKSMTDHALSTDVVTGDDALVETFRKMLKVGLPPDVVRHRMIKDNVPASVMDHVLGQSEKNDGGDNVSKLSSEQENLVSFYNKMLKMGVPKESVRHKMIMENVDQLIVSVVLKENKPAKCAKDMSMSKKSNLVSLHWTPITEDELNNNSIWNFSTKKRKRSTISFMPESQDMSRLEELFQKKNNLRTSSIKVSADDGQHSSQSKVMAKIIDVTRAQNVAISLKAFREFSFDELIDIIRNLDASNKIQGERVQFMKDFLPTSSEEKAIAAFTGSDSQLQPVELFFRKLSSVPRASAKIAIIQAMANFTQLVEDVLGRFNLLFTVCTQVMSSEKLQLILEAILTIGNIMNQGTHSGDAVGFKFESLLKLTDTKSADGSLTVLDYIVTTFIDKRQRIVLDLVSDFPDCQVASRIAITDIVNDVASLGKSVKECKTELLKMKNELSIGPKAKVSVKSDGPDKEEKRNLDPRQALLASILVRNKSKTDDSTSDQNVKRSDDSNTATNTEEGQETAAGEAVKNAPGLLRLEDFVRVSAEKMENVEKIRNRTIHACKDLAMYCGESGGERAATTILTILSEFISNLQASIVKYDQKKESETKKRDAPLLKTKEGVHDDSKSKTPLNRRERIISPRQAMLKEIVTAVQSKKSPVPSNNKKRQQNKKVMPVEEPPKSQTDSDPSNNNKSNPRQDLLRSIVDRAVAKKGLR